MKLREIILLAVAAGFLIIWIAEYQRTTFGDSYWLLMLFLIFMLAFQYARLIRLKRIGQKKSEPLTIQQPAEKKKKKK